jgi:hypothetical protein
MTMLDHALALARDSYRVFPLEAGGKVPVVKGWPDLATVDEMAIRKWWAEWPNANVGVATGRGLVVLDCDVKDGRQGLSSLALMDALGLPTSMRVVTPSGGIHVYLRTSRPWANSVDRLKDFPGIDVRGENGFVVGPGSVVAGVAYCA